MSLIDISPALRVGMAVFPGDADYRVAQTFTIGPGCPVNVGSFAMSTHCGAHADAPLHYDAEGATIDQLDIGDFIGPARVIDARGNDPLCHFDEIAAALDGAPTRLLFRLADRDRSDGVAVGVPFAVCRHGGAAGTPRHAPDRRGRSLRRSGDIEGPAIAHGLPPARRQDCRELGAGRRRTRRLRVDRATPETRGTRCRPPARGAEATVPAMKHRHAAPDSAMLGWSVDRRRDILHPGPGRKREENLR